MKLDQAIKVINVKQSKMGAPARYDAEFRATQRPASLHMVAECEAVDGRGCCMVLLVETENKISRVPLTRDMAISMLRLIGDALR